MTLIPLPDGFTERRKEWREAITAHTAAYCGNGSASQVRRAEDRIQRAFARIAELVTDPCHGCAFPKTAGHCYHCHPDGAMDFKGGLAR